MSSNKNSGMTEGTGHCPICPQKLVCTSTNQLKLKGGAASGGEFSPQTCLKGYLGSIARARAIFKPFKKARFFMFQTEANHSAQPDTTLRVYGEVSMVRSYYRRSSGPGAAAGQLGATLGEFGILIALISLVAVFSVAQLGDQVAVQYERACLETSYAGNPARGQVVDPMADNGGGSDCTHDRLNIQEIFNPDAPRDPNDPGPELPGDIH